MELAVLPREGLKRCTAYATVLNAETVLQLDLLLGTDDYLRSRQHKYGLV
jgi:hypothetical protein